METWEIVILALGVALVAVSVYLIITLSKLNKLIARLDILVMNNSGSITSIVNNVDSITEDTKTTVENVSNAIKKPLQEAPKASVETTQQNSSYEGIKSLITVASFAYGVFKYMQDRKKNKRINKIYKEMKNKH